MASDFDAPITPEEAVDALVQVRSDRSALDQRRRTPFAIALGFGLVAGAYVCRPAISNEVMNDAIGPVGFAAALLVVFAYTRATGVKGRRTTARQWLVVIAAMTLCLILLSVSYGLVALDLTGWVVATTAVAVLGVTAVVTLPGHRR